MESRVDKPIFDTKPIDVELLGKPIHIIRDKLEKLVEECCSGLANELQHWLSHNKIEVNLVSVDLHRFSITVLDKDQTSTYQHQDGGMVYIHSDANALIKMSDRFYGAEIERKSPSLTASDLRLQERISRIVLNWIAPEDEWQTCEYETPRGIGLHLQLSIACGDFHGAIHLKLDSTMIQTLIVHLDLHNNTDLYQSFCRSLESTPVRLKVVLSKKNTVLNDVAGWQSGDILPIELLNTMPVSIGNQTLFSGRVAEQDGQLVLILNPGKELQR